MRSEWYFERANEYVPERWLRENKTDVHPFLVLPFGHGTRMCAGKDIRRDKKPVQ